MPFTREDLRQIVELIRPTRNRIRNVVARAVIGIVDESKKLQLVQLGILKGEDGDGAENFQGFGFKSVPLPGAEAVTVFPDGDRGVALVVATEDRRHRPTGWNGGEAGLYNAFGVLVRLKDDGTATVVGATVKLGSEAATEAAVKGTAYRTAEDIMLTAVGAAFTALAADPALAAGTKTACTAGTTAITTFQAAAASYLAVKVKVE